MAVAAAAIILPVLLAVGFAVDYTRITETRNHMQNAADAAALAASVENTLSKSKRKKIARDVFSANFDDFNPAFFKVDFIGDTVRVTTKVNLPMTFMGLGGKTHTPIDVASETTSSVSEIEIALVLDVSGSMRAGLGSGKNRLTVLKESAHLLLDKLDALKTAKVKVGIVPFTMNVNIGKSRKTLVEGEDDPLFAGTEWKGCVFAQSKGNYVADNPKTKFRAWAYPPLPDASSGSNICYKNASNGTNDAYGNLEEINFTTSLSAQYDGPNRNCVRHELLPLTSNLTTVRNQLNSLTAEGNDGTIIGPGVTWGLRVLSPGWPFKQASSWKSNSDKIMIVLTDGEQTTEAEYQSPTCNMVQNSTTPFMFDPATHGLTGKVLNTYGPRDNLTPYGFIRDSDPFSTNPGSWTDVRTNLESISLAACAEAKRPRKNKKIDVYAIGVSNQTAPGTGVYNLLRNCASAPDKHYFAPDAKSLEGAFDDIATRVSKLRLSY